MGHEAKALLPIGRTRIIDLQLTTLRAVADQVAIVSTDTTRYGGFGVPVWPDLQPGRGPLGGILTALVNAGTPSTLVVAGDMPFLTVAFLRYLVAAAEGVDVAIPHTTEGYQPLCAVYNRTCMKPIERRLEEGVLKVTELLSLVNVRELRSAEVRGFDPDGTLFFNVNTPADYKRSLLIAKHRQPRTPEPR